MHTVLRALVVVAAVLGAGLSAAGTPVHMVHMVYEQEEDGSATHRAVDLTSIGDGIDPVLQFILLDEPTEPTTAQVLWQASAKPVHWNSTAAEHDWRFVDHAVLPAGSSIEYRVFLGEAGFELFPLRHTRTEEDENFGVDPTVIDLLPNATYELQAHISVPDRPGKVLKQRISVSQSEEEVEPDPPPVEEQLLMLEPGTGFVGETKQPAQIGNVSEIAIAQWNVVPQQQISGEFHLGVVAHHIDGIDHVAISVDGGPWAKIFEASINPRTGSEEYWATLDVVDRKGWQEVRAIAVPKAGQPRLLSSIRLYAGENDKLFPQIVLQPGTYDAQKLIGPAPKQGEGWITIRAADGVDRSKVIITGNASSSGRHLRFENITRKMTKWDEHNSRRNSNSWWWFDDCRIEGNRQTRWILNEGGRQYYTDTTITDINATFQSALLLARNVKVERAIEDVCRSFGMMVNVTIEELDRGEFTKKHPDLFQWHGSDLNNFIAQDVTSLNNVGQGLFSGAIRNSAFVRMNINVSGNYYGLHMLNKTRNVLLKDFNVRGGFGCILRPDFRFFVPEGQRLVIENSSRVRNADLPGIEVRP
ncbi:MAG: hypothetical protein KTR15_06585 [Phycisphaeraceae bacterium]|nr:hypothetical protein [Phycisphaeraceae bacterium]